MQCDVLIMGPVSLDFEQVQDGPVHKFIGGSLLYSSYAELSSGRHVVPVVKMAPEDSFLLDAFYLNDMISLPSEETTSFHLQYHSPDRETRTILVKSVADTIGIRDIPDIDAKIYQMAGVVNGDISAELFEILSKRGKVACDIQGWMKHNREGVLECTGWDEKEQYLPYVTYLKADAMEAEILTGTADCREAAKIMHGWGAKEILITQNKEVLAYDGTTFYTCPIRARNLTGRTGRGDTTFGSYITERLERPPAEALLYATALVSLKMEKFGPFKGTRNQVADYIREMYSEY